MDKLIELLNEAKPLKKYQEYWYNWEQIKLVKYAEDYAESISEDITEKVISKKFWFIQRLVENDKIDFYTILKENWTFRKEFYAIENKKEYERLIMLLSISDTPIEDLIKYLK